MAHSTANSREDPARDRFGRVAVLVGVILIFLVSVVAGRYGSVAVGTTTFAGLLVALEALLRVLRSDR